MLKAVLVVLGVIACPLLWTMIIVPLIAKSFGVPIKVGALPIDTRSQRLSRRQSFVFAGVLGWGVGLFLLGTLVQRFVDLMQPTIANLLFELLWCLFIGGLLSQKDWTYPLENERVTGNTQVNC